MSVKEIIEGYYRELMTTNDVEQYYHRNMLVDWHGSRGFLQMNAEDLIMMIKQVDKYFISSRIEITHLIVSGNEASVRYNHYGVTKDSSFEEKLISTSIGIWQLKDNKLYRGYVMGHSD
ncbi:hypothetical protein [Flavobacterium rhizosphaerae]|uniref:Nuclear transport factor 2 family protein n=1 Tax=Flavobacterium rhizosphaerae TaxID=3163298 RepID=A0ABW8YW18_9FLAO